MQLQKGNKKRKTEVKHQLPCSLFAPQKRRLVAPSMTPKPAGNIMHFELNWYTNQFECNRSLGRKQRKNKTVSECFVEEAILAKMNFKGSEKVQPQILYTGFSSFTVQMAVFKMVAIMLFTWSQYKDTAIS